MKSLFLVFACLIITISTFGRSLYKVEGNSVIVDLEGIGVKSRILKVEIWSDKTVKIISGMEKEFSSFQTLIPQGQPLPVKFKVGYAQNNIEISTKEVIISVQEDGLVRIFNREGNKLLIESDRFFDPLSGGDAKFKIKQRYFLNVHENIYGFGYDNTSPRYNLRGNAVSMKQSASSIASPVIFSEKGYALIWDNYSTTNLNDQKSGLEISSDFADEIQYFFIYGPSWDDVIAEIRALTGAVPMLPRWAFGHWAFPEFYSSGEVVQSKIEQYNNSKTPAEKNSTLDVSMFEEEKLYKEIGIKKRLSCYPASTMKNKYADAAKTVFDRRFCIPTHTNYPGTQAYGTFLVTGESDPSWESFKIQVIAASNLPLSGQPYWSTMIGGTSGQNIDKELLTRWYQFAAFTPVFMLPKPDRDIFSLKYSSSFDVVTDVIMLRYHLLPYIYSTAFDVSTANKTFTRSLLFDYQKVEKTHQIDQQFLFGESMMVCPVTAPAISQLPVYFPPDSAWYDFFTGKKYDGDSNQKIYISENYIPVFVKSGSVIPFASIGNNTSDSLYAPMEIRVYPGNNGKFILYEDGNDGNGYKNGLFSKIPIIYSEKEKTVSIGPTEGTFPGIVTERIFRIAVVSDSTGIGNKMSEKVKEVIYKGKKVKIKL